MPAQEFDFSDLGVGSSPAKASKGFDFSDLQKPLKKKAVAPTKPQGYGDQVKSMLQSTVMDKGSPTRDLAAGVMKYFQDMGQNVPDLATIFPKDFQSSLPYKAGQRPVETADPYQIAGTTEKPFDTTGGKLQTAGEYGPLVVTGYPVAKAGGKLLKAGIADLMHSAMPSKHAASFLNELGGGKTLETHGKDFAKKIKNTYDEVKKGFTKKYDSLFSEGGLGNKELYPLEDVLAKGGRAKATGGERYYRDMPEFPSGRGEEDYQEALKAFKDKPTVKNAHTLQSELAAEERMLKRDIKSARMRGDSVKGLNDDLKLTVNSREKLLNKIHETMGSKADKYKDITSGYLKEVIPYHGNSNLLEIVKGKVTNPGSSAFKDIFSHADEGVETIVKHLGKGSKDDILFQALGKNPKLAHSGDLSSGIKNLLNSGFEHYLSPSHIKTAEKLGESDVKRLGKLGLKIAGIGTAGKLIKG